LNFGGIVALKGLIIRREIWVPTLRGFILLMALCATGFLGLLYGIHPFLAANYPNGQGILIVEGWLSDKDLELALPMLKDESYSAIITIGGPLDDDSIYIKAVYIYRLFPNQNNWADIIATQIIGLGVSKGRVRPVPIPRSQTDRTYTSAIAIKRWLIRSCAR
jgi:hypothetical protein